MLELTQSRQSIILSLLIGSFFIFPLFFKISYHLIPFTLSLYGLYLFIKNHKSYIEQNVTTPTKLLTLSFASYFIIPFISMLQYQGSLSEIDLSIKAILLLPILFIFKKVKININYILATFLLACFILGIAAVIQKFILNWEDPFMPYNRIIAGNITIAMAVLSLGLSVYFYRIKNNKLTIITSLAFVSVFLASLLCQNRGALVGFALGFVTILWFNRDLLSKKLILFFGIMTIVVGITAYQATPDRWNLVEKEITQCINAVDKNQCNTSIGFRLQFYKSSIKGFQEKPILGWGKFGTITIHKKHAQSGYVSRAVDDKQYPHAHNIFFEFLTRYGLLGLFSLLSVFLIPCWIFYNNMKQQNYNHQTQLVGIIGISFIMTIIGNGLTDVLMIHRIGNMFYFTTIVFLIGLQKITNNYN